MHPEAERAHGVDRVGVVVEHGTSEEIFHHAQHPYTQQLLAAVPHLAEHVDDDELAGPPNTRIMVDDVPVPLSEPRSDEPPALLMDDVAIVYPKQGRRPEFRAAEHINLRIDQGEVIGLVGESGCGKTTLAYGIQRLLRPPATIPGGSVVWHDADGTDTDVLGLSADAMMSFRWDKISMVFQGAMNALNPVATIGSQLADVFEVHRPQMTRVQRTAAVVELLDIVKPGAQQK